MQASIVGWDIGGAHIKAVILSASGIITQVIQKPCPLWKGIDYLSRAISEVLIEIPEKHALHVMTMTGELVDFFDSREQGVEQIIFTVQVCLIDSELLVYAGRKGLVNTRQINKTLYTDIASTNWLASASYAALQSKCGLFIDIGSTTTDILVLSDYDVLAQGLTDYQRLVSDELVYTGIVRTAVMAVTVQVDFLGQKMGLMAEYFATMADIYRLTGDLNESHDQTETADGAEKTLFASAKRLSRMTGYEYSDNDLKQWQQLAVYIKAQQKNRIVQGCEKQLSRGLISKNDCFIGAGVGRFLVQEIALELGRPYIDFTELFQSQLDNSEMSIADCAPAAAVAYFALSSDEIKPLLFSQ